jgi:hypothetical protein
MNITSLCFFLFGTSLGGLAIYESYFYGKRKVSEYVMGKVFEELNKRMEQENKEEMFKPVEPNAAIIKVTSSGKTHSVYVPYNRKRCTAMLRKKVYLIKDGEKIELTQKPGIPYLICAANMGGTSIIVENLDGEQVFTFSENEIPNCF